MLDSNMELQTKNILNSNQYNSIRRLGKGGFGHVLLATKATSSSTYYAVKCISKKKMIKDPQLKRFLIQEINTMASLDHLNIVKLYKTFEEGDWYFLVMEYCDIGNLYNFQSKLSSKVFSLEEATLIFMQILNGVKFIHSNHIIHRDLKLQNIFLKKSQKDSSYICKIGDFGLARQMGMEETAITNCGTECYMAPEIFYGVKYDKQVDIWALGVLLYYLLFAEFPFKGINILSQIQTRCKGGYHLLDHIKNKNYFRNKKEEINFCHLFENVFEIEPSKRITLKQLQVHAAMRRKQAEKMVEESTMEEDDDESLIQWEIERINFMLSIVQTIENYNFLTFYLLSAFKFYINKVILSFLNKENIRSYKKDQESDKRLIQKLNQVEAKCFEQMKLQYDLLQKNQSSKESIDKFEDGLNMKIQDFISFKIAYRNTVGRVYEEVHKSFGDNSYQRSSLKLKIFFCHLINRVFTGNVSQNVFPHYLAWINKNNLKISYKYYNFDSIEEWIRKEKSENLQRSQETINQIFYK